MIRGSTSKQVAWRLALLAGVFGMAWMGWPRQAAPFGGISAATRVATRPATGPASAAATPGGSVAVGNAVLADELLKDFPKNAAALAQRADAKDITVEGRVRDLYDDKTGGHKLVLVGEMQADTGPAHITCPLAQGPAWNGMKYIDGDIVQLRGAIGATSADENRVELKDIKKVTFIRHQQLTDAMLGTWRSMEVTPDNVPGRRMLEFRPDGTFTCEYLSNVTDERIRMVRGKWSAVSETVFDVDLGGKLTLTVDGKEPQTGVVKWSKDCYLSCDMPGFEGLPVRPKFGGQQSMGKQKKVDYQKPVDLAVKWLTDHTSLAEPQQMLSKASEGLAPFVQNENGFALMVGGEVLKEGKAATLLGFDEHLFPIMHDAVQVGAKGKPNTIQASSLRFGKMMVPEVKIDGLEFEKGLNDAYLNGKIKMHTLGRRNNGGVGIYMVSPGGYHVGKLKEEPVADIMEYDVQFGFHGDQEQAIPGIFVLVRLVNDELLVVSEPVAQLVKLR